MTEFEKIALLYLAHQSEMLHVIAKKFAEQVDEMNRIRNGFDTRELARDIRAAASDDTLRLLGDFDGLAKRRE